MSTGTWARLPFEPLAVWFADSDNEHTTEQMWNFRIYGISADSFHRAKRDGLVVRKAEDWCDMLGVHPAEVWGDAYYEAAGVRITVAV